MKKSRFARDIFSMILVCSLLATNFGFVTYADVTTPVAVGETGTGNSVETAITENVTIIDSAAVDAVNVSADSGAEAQLDVQGDILAESTSSDAKGLNASATYGGDAEAIIQGNIEAEASNGSAVAVVGTAIMDGSNTEITITGDVSADGVEAVGIFGRPDNGGSLGITVDGNVDANGDNTASGVTVIFAGSPIPDPSETEINVTGSVTVDSNTEATGIEVDAIGEKAVTVNVKEDVTANTDTGNKATAIDTFAGIDSSATVQVGGDITANAPSGSAEGIHTVVEDDGIITVTAEGSIEAVGKGDGATGVGAFANDQGEIKIEIQDEIKVESGSGVYAVSSDDSNTEISVGGAVTVTGTEYAAGMTLVINGGDVDVNAGPVTVTAGQYQQATAINIATVNGTGTVEVDGDISTNGFGINVAMGVNGTGETKVLVDGDVQAGAYALTAITNENSAAVSDILVDGTLHGDAHAIVIDEKTTEDNLKLTVWKIDLDEDGDAVKGYKPGYGISTTENSTKIEESIMYIIRVEQPAAGATLSAVDQNGNALDTSHDLSVANEGDTVILKVNLEAGYNITGAYSDEGKSVQLLQDENGDYYVEVPKGGGVYLSVELEKTSSGYGYVSYTDYVTNSTPEKEDSTDSAKSIKVVFDYNGGYDSESHAEGTVTRFVAPGTWVQLPTALRHGAKFLRWESDVSSITVTYPGAYFCAKENVTFKAIWSDGYDASAVAVPTEPMEDSSTGVVETADEIPAVAAEATDLSASRLATDQESAESNAKSEASVVPPEDAPISLNLNAAGDESAATILTGLGDGVQLKAKLVIDLGDGKSMELPVNIQMTLADEVPVSQ